MHSDEVLGTVLLDDDPDESIMECSNDECSDLQMNDSINNDCYTNPSSSCTQTLAPATYMNAMSIN